MFQTFNEFLVKKQFDNPMSTSHKDSIKAATLNEKLPFSSNIVLPKYSSLLGKNARLNQPVQKSPAEFLKRGVGFAPTTNARFKFKL